MPDKDLTDRYANLFKRSRESMRLANEEKKALLPEFSSVDPARSPEEREKRVEIIKANMLESNKRIRQEDTISRFSERVQQAPLDIARQTRTGEYTLIGSQYNNMKQALDEYQRGLVSGLEDSKLKPLANKLEASFTPELRKKFEDENKMSVSELAVDVLGGSIFKSDARKEKERYHAVLDTGIDPQRALAASEAWKNGDNFDYTFEERQALLSHDASSVAWALFDTAFLITDIVTLGATASARLAVRGALKEATKEASKLAGRDAIREALVRRVPELADSQQLETAVEIIERSQSIAKLKETGEYKDVASLLRTNKKELVKPTAQSSVVYENGVPVIRRASSEVTGEALKVRSEIKEALSGSLEDLRLSNKEMLDRTVKAGVLPKGTKLDGSVDVYLMGGRKVKNGSQVTPNATLAGEGAKTVKVAVEDLVQLSDGTFTVVNKRVVGKDLSAPISQIRREMRQDVLKKEMQTEAKKRSKELAKERARENARIVEQQAREAAAQAERDAVEKSTKAIQRSQEMIKSAKAIKPIEVTATRRAVVNAGRDIVKTASSITKIESGAKEMLKATTVKTGLTPKQMLKKFDKFLPSGYKNKLRKGNDLTAFERKNLAKRIIKDRNSRIADANESLRLSQVTLRDSKMKLKSLETIKAQEKIAKETIKTESAKLKELEGVKEVRQTTNKIVNAKTTKQVEDIKATAPVNPKVGKTRVGTKIVDSTTVSNKLLFEAKKMKGLNVGDEAVQMGTTVQEQAELSAKFFNTRGIEDAFKVLMGESSKGDEFANITNEGLRHNLNVVLRETGQTLNYTDELERLTQRFADIAGGTAQEQRFRQYSIQSDPLQYLVRLKKKMMESKGLDAKAFDSEVSKIEKEINAADGKIDIKEIISKSLDDNLC